MNDLYNYTDDYLGGKNRRKVHKHSDYVANKTNDLFNNNTYITEKLNDLYNYTDNYLGEKNRKYL